MSEQKGEYKTKAGRKSGFYWVQFKATLGLWECAYWNSDSKDWSIIRTKDRQSDSAFSKINEERIKTPDEL